MLSATPRFPEEDSTRTDLGVKTPSRSAASTISIAAFSLIDPAKLKPSHFKNSRCPKVGSRSTYRSSASNPCGVEMIGTLASVSLQQPLRRGPLLLFRTGAAVCQTVTHQVFGEGWLPVWV